MGFTQLRLHAFAGLALLAGASTSTGLSQARASGTSRMVAVHFTGSDAAWPNPERGFYRAGPGDLSQLDQAFLDRTYKEGYRLVYARINLEPYRNKPLPEEYLRQLGDGFAAARRGGVKLIVRAVYNYPKGETEYRSAKDAPLPLVLRHLSQLKPVLRANADVVAFVQGGFVGAWGEWHTSSNGLAQPAARTAIKDALLAAVPIERYVQFRYPPHIQAWKSQQEGSPDPSAMRIGFHNDCFLASRTDVGTFSDEASARANEQQFIDRLGDLAPFGGETCNPADDPDPAPRTGCADILTEGARYNLTYLNADYYRRLFHESWAAGGCSNDVAARMGYRLRLVDLTHPERAKAGEDFTLSLTVANDGWARLFNPRRMEVLLRSRQDGTVHRLPAPGVNTGQWLPGARSAVSLNVTFPGALRAGEYEVLLAMVDGSERLRGDPRYAIRPANADDPSTSQGWDAAVGAFRTGSGVTIVRGV